MDIDADADERQGARTLQCGLSLAFIHQLRVLAWRRRARRGLRCPTSPRDADQPQRHREELDEQASARGEEPAPHEPEQLGREEQREGKLHLRGRPRGERERPRSRIA